MTEQLSTFSPDWVSAPGETILDMLDEMGWKQTAFSQRLGFSQKHVSNLVSGKAAITEDAAIKLERVLGNPASFWMNRETQYREALARKKALSSLESDVDWPKMFPLSDMIKFKWIRRCSSKTAQVEELLRFFGVVSVEVWRQRYAEPCAAFRTSNAVQSKQGAVAAWVRQGERVASTKELPPFNRQHFKRALLEAHQLTNEADPHVFMPALIEICAAAGVVVVFEPVPKGCPASGMTKWVDTDKALLMLSFRYKTNDHFWFSFFHEAGHLLHHGKKMMFIESRTLDGTHEDEANAFAEQWLINSKYNESLRNLPHTAEAITSFAEEVGVPAGIVVGRLQSDGLLPWKTPLNSLKVYYAWEHRVSAPVA